MAAHLRGSSTGACGPDYRELPNVERTEGEMSVKHIFVVGAGTMGNGIAQTAAVSGYQVTMMDVTDEFVKRGKTTIEKTVSKILEKGRITEQQKAAAQRFALSTDQAQAAAADLIIEAATENPELKLKLFQDLDGIAKPGVILASNTSSISINKLAAATQRPDQGIGMHFFNPVPIMTLLEVVRGQATSDETLATALEVGKQMGKTAVVVKDSPGFVSNRVLCPMINEAILALDEGVADAEGT